MARVRNSLVWQKPVWQKPVSQKPVWQKPVWHRLVWQKPVRWRRVPQRPTPHRLARQASGVWQRLARRPLAGERGAATAEYAIATMAAVGFAGLLVAILRSDAVRGMLMELVHRALTFGG